ncbi:MAG: sugar-binding protein, partial [Opitutaceae bacterium]|nr:sugar-binding protein [Cytophagales bacterium]
MLKIVSILSLALLLLHPGEKQTAKQTNSKILIDGLGFEKVWNTAEWKPLDQAWIGNNPDPSDFSGRYKLLWDENQLYLLAEIQDDTLIDIYKDK